MEGGDLLEMDVMEGKDEQGGVTRLKAGEARWGQLTCGPKRAARVALLRGQYRDREASLLF